MHHIYHTRAIIFGSRNFGESGKLYYLFTRELGMVYASATGVRKLESKLRYVLQDYTYVNVDLVRGKDMWRVTSASKTDEVLDFRKNQEAFRIHINIARLLKRLLAGEDANPALFDDLLNGVFVLAKNISKEELQSVEVVIVLKCLNHLGYIGDNKDLFNLISSPFEQGAVFEASKNRLKVLREINKALRETQM